MPIYGDKLTSTQYKLVKEISVNDFRSLKSTYKKAINSFPYKDKYNFIKTIKYSDATKSVSYYKIKAKVDNVFDQNYRANLQAKAPYIADFYNDPRMAIDDYTYGMMMESLIKYCNQILPKSSKYLFDIGGSWTNGKIIILQKK